MAKMITFDCSGCSEQFSEPVQAFIDALGDEVQAPALCRECGCDAED